MNKIGIIGDPDSVLGFKAVGLETFPCVNDEEASQALRQALKQDFGILYITESIYKNLLNEINETATGILPAIVAIPGSTGNEGVGLSNIKRAVEKAVGADILFNVK